MKSGFLVIVLFISLVGRGLAKEQVDPLSGVRYELAEGVRTKTTTAQLPDGFIYALVAVDPKVNWVLVYATTLRSPKDRRPEKQYVEEEGEWKSDRSNRHIVKGEWRTISGRSYFVTNAYDVDEGKYSYCTQYLAVFDGFCFRVSFTTDYAQEAMWEKWDKVVSLVKFPEPR